MPNNRLHGEIMLEIRRAEEEGSADFGWLKLRMPLFVRQYCDPRLNGYSEALVCRG